MLKYTFLTDAFYQDYANCTEIEKKRFRPHVQLTLNVNGILWCIPMRSHITHPNAYMTDAQNHCGVDFSKAVVILDTKRYLDTNEKPRIRKNEFDALRGKEHIILQRFTKYIKDYKEAKERIDIPRNADLVKKSTLQYFEDYI